MATVRPTQLWNGYTSDGTNITIPIASLSKLTVANANANTGNAADVLWALLDKAVDSINGLSAEAKPTKFALTRANLTVVPGTAGTIRQDYGVQIQLTPTTLDTVEEQ